MSKLRTIYRILRSILFTTVLTVAGLFICIYVAISLPIVENKIKDEAEKIVSRHIGSDVRINELDIYPFNEVRINGLSVKDKNDKVCLYVETLGAGINIWKLIVSQKIELTYGEISGMNANIYQPAAGKPLNIQFIIDSFKPKDKTKPPTQFDLKLHNIVIRKSKLKFNRTYIPAKADGSFDPNHIEISDLKADIALPKLKNNDFVIDCRRISLNEKSGFDLENLSFKTHITDKSISVNNLVVKLPGTELRPADIQLTFKNFSKIKEALSEGNHQLVLVGNEIDPQDFACFYTPLGRIGFPLTLNIDISGNLDNLHVEEFKLSNPARGIQLSATASLENILNNGKRVISLTGLEADIDYESLPSSSKQLLQSLNDKFSAYAQRLGRAQLTADAEYNEKAKSLQLALDFISDCGDLTLNLDSKIDCRSKANLKDISLFAQTEGLNVGKLIDNPTVGTVVFEAEASASSPSVDCDANMTATIDRIDLRQQQLTGISIQAEKQRNLYNASLNSTDDNFNLSIESSALMAGINSRYELYADIVNANLRTLHLNNPLCGYIISGGIQAEATGNTPDNISGELNIAGLSLSSSEKSLFLKRANLFCENTEENEKRIELESDWAEFSAKGKFRYEDIIPLLQNEIAQALPAVVKTYSKKVSAPVYADMMLKLYPTEMPYQFLGIDYRPAANLIVTGNLNSDLAKHTVQVEAPLILKGRDKYIRDTKINLCSDNQVLSANTSLIWPVKNGEAPLELNANVFNNRATVDLGWDLQADKKIKGSISLDAVLSHNDLSSRPDIIVDIKPSTFYLRDDKWNIDPVKIAYTGTSLQVDNMKIWHDRQFVDIRGRASQNPEDELAVELASIDLNYIFNFLNINYVTFGGMATGRVTASEIFSKNPQAATEYLHVKDLSYNGAVLGDGDLASHWDNNEKKVTIFADIKEKGTRRARVDGGIWVTRDSLAFALDADSVNIKFLQPFMQAFSSDVQGCASGKATLYGTFKDIDLVGRLHADRLRMKLDYTNVYYSGSDSVYLTPGRIEIPKFRLFDAEGHSALLTGWLTHNYFHEPKFQFRLSDAKSLLCYNTNKKINPDWYGKTYCNGNALLNGRPGFVSLDVDMATTKGSSFTFELNDTQVAEDYNFLSFSDKKKERLLAEQAEIELAHNQAAKSPKKQEETGGTIFSMRIMGTVNNGTDVVLVMDPKAGDKIRAKGDGALQVSYDTESDEMKIYGKYILEQGKYNFSLQDLILREFTIRPGSSISFNGDPLKADLDITAMYRVNTNLSDLDKSFASDKELNRTNVPVDAVLNVKGDMEHPDIFFDIEMPTLTQDVARKVKSIISTDDLMNRQIIYLLALNRFYTPEYMGGSNGSAELASVASSTISSQLSNMMGQLTNKISLSPSIRSDKGDFSDMEVDLALSSHLLNNRLLINGNFGYRDRATSQTTFVGDFDIEYLLSKSGNLRLKAYNHFNDQNYYLRTALTTQGVGVVYRRDFDNIFSFLKKKRKPEKKDSVTSGHKESIKDSTKQLKN